jgi:GNAT superfamily N-acetyltransferase
LIRPAVSKDIVEIAKLYVRSRAAAMPWLPNMHTAEDDLNFFANKVFPTQALHVAIMDDTLAGFIAFENDWVNQLYLDQPFWRQSIGSELLGLALKDVPYRQLWVFEQNHAAQKFYTRHGFQVVERTDGSNNEEGCPDLRMEWRA